MKIILDVGHGIVLFRNKKYFRNTTSFHHKWVAIRKGRIAGPVKPCLSHLGTNTDWNLVITG